MANKERGEVSFDALGKTWTMKIGTDAMCAMEDKAGKGISEIAAELGGASVKLSTLRLLIWAGLQHHHEGLSLKECSEIIDDFGVAEIGPIVGQAFQAAFPKKDADARPPEATAA